MIGRFFRATTWIMYLSFLLTFSSIHTNKIIVTERFRQVISQNRVALTCFGKGNDDIWGGQGTIVNTDLTGVWILTANHVANNTDHCDAEFNDQSVHTAYTSKIYQNSDIAVMFAPRAYWPTHAALVDLKLGEDVADFGPVTVSFVRDEFGVQGVGFIFNDKISDGQVILPFPGTLFHYSAPKGNMYLTNLFSAPGTSGGGVYDSDGNLVGVVSGGSALDDYVCYIVAAKKAEDEEPDTMLYPRR